MFRRFEGVPNPADSDEEDPGSTPYQLSLKRAVGSAASRPMTRSSIQPRLLFQSFDSGYGASDDVDEEAETDVEMSDAPPVDQVEESAEEPATVATPAKTKSAPPPMMSPPTTKRASRKHDVEAMPVPADAAARLPTPARSSRKKKVEMNAVPIYHDGTPEPTPADEDVPAAAPPPTPARSSRKKKIETHLTPVIEEEEESQSASGGYDTSPAPAFTAGRRKNRSPFDNWPRTKGAHKRDGEPLEGSSTGTPKRTRSTTRQVSA